MEIFWGKIWKFIKGKCWYLILLIASSIYVWSNRCKIYQLSELNVRNLIFLLWLLLLLLPLFSEMEFLGVKVKKEVEKANKDINDSLRYLQNQVNQIQLSNSVSNNISFSNTPLPPEEKLEELLQLVQNLQSTPSGSNAVPENPLPLDDDKNVFLFKIRMEIETFLRALCEKVGLQDKLPLMKMVQALNNLEVITGMTQDLIGQVIRIANRGVHGEIISEEYISFVKKTYPEIMRQLKEASAKLVYINCPHCGYFGYSRYENSCPRCGYITDD